MCILAGIHGLVPNHLKRRVGYFEISAQMYLRHNIWPLITQYIQLIPLYLEMTPNKFQIIILYGVSPHFEEVGDAMAPQKYEIIVTRTDPIHTITSGADSARYNVQLQRPGAGVIRIWPNVDSNPVPSTDGAQSSPTPGRTLLMF